MKNVPFVTASSLLTALLILIFNACSPLREFGNMPPYKEAHGAIPGLPPYDSLQKTVVIVANNDGTELFDMLAPYSLFNSTQKANVYIVAKNKSPIVVKKGFYLLPQLTFSEVDSLGIDPDVIVIPYLSAADSLHQDPHIIHWIQKHYSSDVRVLSVCDGSATAAATGIFDGKPLTAHASDYEGIKAQFKKPSWVNNISVANNGNLYSTAGVSNATDGSLLVIRDLLGTEVMNRVREGVFFPVHKLTQDHRSSTFTSKDRVSVARKLLLSGNRKVGVLLWNGIDEFHLAAVMDTYNRTFPKSIQSFSMGDQPVRTKYGLTLIPTGKTSDAKLDEIHLIGTNPDLESRATFKNAKLVMHDSLQKLYIIDECLRQIRSDYGPRFERVVKLMLDYN